jgi:hypothetical protein
LIGQRPNGILENFDATESAMLANVFDKCLTQDAWLALERRVGLVGLATLLREVLLSHNSPLLRAPHNANESCADPLTWMDWPSICTALEHSLDILEHAAEKAAQKRKPQTRLDMFPRDWFSVLLRSTLNELVDELKQTFEGPALLREFRRIRSSLCKLFQLVGKEEVVSLDEWKEDQPVLLNWQPIQGPESCYTRSKPPIPFPFDDAFWRRTEEGKNRTELIVTPAGHYSDPHNDDNGSGFMILQVRGYKVWFVWEGAEEHVREQYARAQQGLYLGNIDWCCQQFGPPKVYLMQPGSILIAGPSDVHAVLGLTASAHWSLSFVSEKLRHSCNEMMSVWQSLLDKSPSVPENEVFRDFLVARKKELEMARWLWEEFDAISSAFSPTDC